jgi:hypothetical protein
VVAVKTLLLLEVTLLEVLMQEVPLVVTQVVTQVQKAVTQVPLVMLGQALELQVKEDLTLTQGLPALQGAST